MASKLLVFLEQVYRAGAAKTAVAPNSWAVICLWRRFFQLKDEESEQSVEILASALEQVVDERDDCPIACEEVAQARKDFIRDYYRQLLGTGGTGTARGLLVGGGMLPPPPPPATSTAATSAREAFAALVEQAHNAQVDRVARHRPNLTIPVSNREGRVVEHLQLAQ